MSLQMNNPPLPPGVDLTALANESRVPQALIGAILPAVISAVFVVGRITTRGFITKNWGWDDTFTTIAWVLSLGMVVMDCLFVNFGVGRHEIFQTLPDVIATLKLSYVSRIAYQVVIGLTKLGICLFYLRIFQDRKSRYISYAMMAFIVLTTIPLEALIIFACSPVEGSWSLKSTRCINVVPLSIASAASNIWIDLALLVFVLPKIVRLKLNRQQKVSLLFVASLGFLVVIAAIVRLTLIIQVSSNQSDLSFNGYEISTWSSVEISTGFFCSCAPTIRPLLRKIAPGFMDSVTKTITRSVNRSADGRAYGDGSISGRGQNRSQAFELTSRSDEDIEFAKLKRANSIYAKSVYNVATTPRQTFEDLDSKSMKTDPNEEVYDFDFEGFAMDDKSAPERVHIERTGGRSVVTSGPRRPERLSTESEIARFEHI